MGRPYHVERAVSDTALLWFGGLLMVVMLIVLGVTDKMVPTVYTLIEDQVIATPFTPAPPATTGQGQSR